jgi:hypothetical protein
LHNSHSNHIPTEATALLFSSFGVFVSNATRMKNKANSTEFPSVQPYVNPQKTKSTEFPSSETQCKPQKQTTAAVTPPAQTNFTHGNIKEAASIAIFARMVLCNSA